MDSNNELYQRIDPDGKAQSLDMDEIRNPIKAILLNIDNKDFDMIAHQLVSQSHGIELIRHYSESYIDVTARGVDKYTTIQYILELIVIISLLVMITMMFICLNMRAKVIL